MATTKQLKLTMYRSMHGRLKAHKSCVRGLGIHKIHNSVVVSDTPENRGMINKISYMLHVEEVLKMKLNNLKPAEGSTADRKRVGRGIGCGWGKTCARGHKGQKARSGGFNKVGFEGGQMPLQRRLPKVGFSSRVGRVTSNVRLHELASVNTEIIDVDALKAANIITKNTLYVKVMLSGTLDKAVTLKGIKVSKGAKQAIESAGGKIED